MARGVPTLTTATLAAAGSPTLQMDAFLPVVEAALAAYLSNATAAWGIYDAIDASLATRDTVYQSFGDRTLVSGAGDTTLYMRIARSTSQFTLRGYQDWSTLSSTGSRQTFLQTVSVTAAALTYWICINEYEVHIVTEQSGAFQYAGWANPARTHIPAGHSGVAFTTSAVTAGSAVVIPIDRSLVGSLTINKNVFIANLTAAGNALESETIEVLPVEAVAATPTVTLSPANSYASGAIIGDDPFCLMSWRSTIADPTLYFTQSRTGDLVAAAPSGSNFASFELPLSSLSEAAEDPHPGTNLYIGQRAFVVDATAASGGRLRGEVQNSSFWGVDTQTTADTMFDLPTGDRYVPFPALLNTSRLLSLFSSAGP